MLSEKIRHKTKRVWYDVIHLLKRDILTKKFVFVDKVHQDL